MAEIRRSPVEVGSLSPYLQGFTHPRWLFGISEPSTVFRTSIDTICWVNIAVNKTSLQINHSTQLLASNLFLGGVGFKHFLCSSLFGEMMQFDFLCIFHWCLFPIGSRMCNVWFLEFFPGLLRQICIEWKM